MMAISVDAVRRVKTSAEPVLTSAERIKEFQGEAYNQDGRLLYREAHRWVYHDDRLQTAHTEYLSPHNGAIARMESDYRKHPYLPDYRFEDFRFQREEGVRLEGNAVVVFGRRAANSQMAQARLALRKNMVGSQGLHFFVNNHLRTLLAGKSLYVHFVVPLRQECYSFAIQRSRAMSKTSATFRISSKNIVLRLLAPHMDVRYDIASGELLQYSGPSNLLTRQGDMQNVVIRYSHSFCFPDLK